jgi:YfiH family protein
MEKRVYSNGVAAYVSPMLERVGVRHAFSTRLGGLSKGIFASMNLGNPSGSEMQDSLELIEKNYQILHEVIGCAGLERCGAHQVHGAGILHVWKGEGFENGQKADALVSDDPDRVAAVRVADCVPVLLSSADGRIAAAVHSGWRGVIAGVVPKTVEAMRERSGVKNADVLAAVGPCIGFDAFEVGGEVLSKFEAVFGSHAPIRRRDDGKGHVDLREGIRRQLMECGLSEDRIDISDRCTFRDAEEFFSHRRERGITGRMAAVIAAAR